MASTITIKVGQYMTNVRIPSKERDAIQQFNIETRARGLESTDTGLRNRWAFPSSDAPDVILAAYEITNDVAIIEDQDDFDRLQRGSTEAARTDRILRTRDSSGRAKSRRWS